MISSQKAPKYSLVAANPDENVNGDGADEVDDELFFVDEEEADDEMTETSTIPNNNSNNHNKEDENDDPTTTTSSSTGTSSRWIEILHHTWLPDDYFLMPQQQQQQHRRSEGGTSFHQEWIESVEAVRLIKFLLMTWFCICFVHQFIRWMDMERDASYTYKEMILYDANSIMTDCIVFFFIGRLYKTKLPVDHLAFFLMVFVGSLYGSISNEYFFFLRHSFTLYEMHCTWPWQLFVFVSIVVPLSILLGVKHVQYSIQTRVLGRKLVELFLCVSIFLLPQTSSPFFHLHHWFAGWLVGMHCNFDTWWSRASLAWFWGMYINGIAVWGRDPLQTCGYALYMSEDARCWFLTCFMHPQVDPNNNETHIVYNDPVIPDWRNCSSTAH